MKFLILLLFASFVVALVYFPAANAAKGGGKQKNRGRSGDDTGQTESPQPQSEEPQPEITTENVPQPEEPRSEENTENIPEPKSSSISSIMKAVCKVDRKGTKILQISASQFKKQSKGIKEGKDKKRRKKKRILNKKLVDIESEIKMRRIRTASEIIAFFNITSDELRRKYDKVRARSKKKKANKKEPTQENNSTEIRSRTRRSTIDELQMSESRHPEDLDDNYNMISRELQELMTAHFGDRRKKRSTEDIYSLIPEEDSCSPRDTTLTLEAPEEKIVIPKCFLAQRCGGCVTEPERMCGADTTAEKAERDIAYFEIGVVDGVVDYQLKLKTIEEDVECTSVCRIQAQDCNTATQTYNEAECQCDCIVQSCTSEKFFNHDSCECQCIYECPDGYTQNLSSCDCIASSTVSV